MLSFGHSPRWSPSISASQIQNNFSNKKLFLLKKKAKFQRPTLINTNFFRTWFTKHCHRLFDLLHRHLSHQNANKKFRLKQTIFGKTEIKNPYRCICEIRMIYNHNETYQTNEFCQHVGKHEKEKTVICVNCKKKK